MSACTLDRYTLDTLRREGARRNQARRGPIPVWDWMGSVWFGVSGPVGFGAGPTLGPPVRGRETPAETANPPGVLFVRGRDGKLHPEWSVKR